MPQSFEVPRPTPAKDTAELGRRLKLLDIPAVDKFTEEEADAWVAEKAALFADASPLKDRDTAEELAFEAASRMYLYRCAYAAVRRQQQSRDRKPSASEIVKASNVASKIPPLLRSLGLVVLHKDVGKGNEAAKAEVDPFGDSDG